MSSSAAGPRASSGNSSSAVSEASSAKEQQANNATALEALSEGASRQAVVGEADVGNNKTSGWLVTSCDVGTAEPRSLSQELERLQVLKSYHIMDPERDEAFDRLVRMASRVMETPYTFLSLVDMGRIWFRSNPDSDAENQLTRDMLSALARVIMKHDAVFDIPDINLDDMFRQGGDSTNSSGSDSSTTQFRFFAGAPLMSPEGYRLGAVCMLSTEPRSVGGLTQNERENLKDFAELAVKTMVDRRKLTTQGSPSHLVACTAHDLITPLTGIQLSLSLLQQDGDFQAKLGDKRKEHISAAVRSSNMMLRICQSTIETLRGNRKIPAATDWSLPRNLMQIAEASPFIDMKEFSANLEAISNSIPRRVPLKVALHPSAPLNIVSDGLKIFRSALNLLSNACSRADTGSIVMTIFDDQDGSLVFECEDNGKEVEIRDSQSLFNQDNDNSNFGLYSVAYQINWLGGKYGVRKGTEEDNSNAEKEGKNSHKTVKTGTIFWFSIPSVLPQDVSELMGLAKSLSDNSEEASIPTFKADLPATPPASPQIYQSQQGVSPTIPKGVVKASETTRTLNALIIEDSTTVRKILGRALSKLGYQVFEAVDGMEGLRELKATMFDMVLCDFLMPVMDGLDCVKQYREWEVTNRQIFRQYIVGISAHASRNDIERGLKLGMDDFKPKPIVLKTLTGLHESAPLGAVRANLDNLLNLPSLEVKRRHSLSSGTYTVPSAATGTIENGGNLPLFAIPGPRESRPKSDDDNKKDAEAAPLFAVPRRPSQLEKEAPPLFSIPPELIDPARKSRKGKSSPSPAPLFSIPESGKQTFSPSPLFSIPPSQPGSDRKSPEAEKGPSPLFAIPSEGDSGCTSPKGPSPLFSIATSQNASGRKSPKGDKSPAPLFAIPASRTASEQKSSTGGSSRSPLFSIAATKASEGGQKPKGALFSISVNPTAPAPAPAPSGGQKRPALFSLQNSQQDGKIKKPALFTIAINTTETQSGTKSSGALFSIGNTKGTTSEAKKPAALFSLSPKSAQSSKDGKNETKKPPLFSLPNNTGEKDAKSPDKAKEPALFALPVNLTEPGGTSKKPSLFDISGRGEAENGGANERASKRPALFALPGRASATNADAKDNGSELAGGDERPKKAMKSALFDIVTRSDDK